MRFAILRIKLNVNRKQSLKRAFLIHPQKVVNSYHLVWLSLSKFHLLRCLSTRRASVHISYTLYNYMYYAATTIVKESLFVCCIQSMMSTVLSCCYRCRLFSKLYTSIKYCRLHYCRFFSLSLSQIHHGIPWTVEATECAFPLKLKLYIRTSCLTNSLYSKHDQRFQWFRWRQWISALVIHCFWHQTGLN